MESESRPLRPKERIGRIELIVPSTDPIASAELTISGVNPFNPKHRAPRRYRRRDDVVADSRYLPHGDEGGPLGLGLQGQGPNHRALLRPKAGVVSGSEKAGCTRQVRAGKTNASEPLMTCRKRRDVTETRFVTEAWEAARRKPADCPSGDRHKDGVSPAQGRVRNVGTCRSDAKGDIQVEHPRGAEYRCGAEGRTGSS